jgi:hypothetical protein
MDVWLQTGLTGNRRAPGQKKKRKEKKKTKTYFSCLSLGSSTVGGVTTMEDRVKMGQRMVPTKDRAPTGSGMEKEEWEEQEDSAAVRWAPVRTVKSLQRGVPSVPMKMFAWRKRLCPLHFVIGQKFAVTRLPRVIRVMPTRAVDGVEQAARV